MSALQGRGNKDYLFSNLSCRETDLSAPCSYNFVVAQLIVPFVSFYNFLTGTMHRAFLLITYYSLYSLRYTPNLYVFRGQTQGLPLPLTTI